MHPQLDVLAAARSRIGISPVSIKKKAQIDFAIDWDLVESKLLAALAVVDPVQKRALRIKDMPVVRVQEVVATLFEYATAVTCVKIVNVHAYPHIDHRMSEVRLMDLTPSAGSVGVEVAQGHFSARFTMSVIPAAALLRSRDELYEAVRRLNYVPPRGQAGNSLVTERAMGAAEELRDAVNGQAVTAGCDKIRLMLHAISVVLADSRKNLRCVGLKRLRELLPAAFPDTFASASDVDEALADAESRNLVAKKLVQTSSGLPATNIYLQLAGRQMLSRPQHSH